MNAASRRAGRQWLVRVRAWEIWGLPRMLKVFIAMVVLADAIAIAASLATLPVHGHDLLVFGLVLACNAATVELTRRASESAGVNKDVHTVWELPVIVLLPAAYVLFMPIVRLALTQWRIRRAPVYRRVFSAAALGIAYGCAWLSFRGLAHVMLASRVTPGRNVSVWIVAVAACAVVQWAVNQALIVTAIKASQPGAGVRVREMVFGSESLHNDVTELCVAILATLAIALSALALVIVLPLVTVLQRSVRHAQLLRDSRADSKTGLLNAATWEREARAEVARAVRTKTPLAVALLDIDRFKGINDTYGHLVGDEVIKEIAHTLDALLREYDLAGRFGGEEFALLLPQTRAVDAFRIAERIRSSVAGLSIIAPGATSGERVNVTVSIGVAALDSGTQREFTELLGAADAALYRAKASGRDQVQMISTSRGVSAISGPGGAGRGVNPANGAHPETPSVFRRAMTS